MFIRPENKNDFDEVYALVKIAFQTAEVTSGKEQDFVNQLRAGEQYIKELALVAEEDGKIRGHIMLSRMPLVNDEAFEGLLVAPLSVELEYRKQGIGSALMKESLKLAKEMGFKAVFLVGNPDYYRRFGFKQIDSLGVKYFPEQIPVANVMGLELVSGALSSLSSAIDFSCD